MLNRAAFKKTALVQRFFRSKNIFNSFLYL